MIQETRPRLRPELYRGHLFYGSGYSAGGRRLPAEPIRAEPPALERPQLASVRDPKVESSYLGL
jgi:hypothetical protein